MVLALGLDLSGIMLAQRILFRKQEKKRITMLMRFIFQTKKKTTTTLMTTLMTAL
jgi:hypothetical protein